MILREWDDLPDNMKNDAVRPYYEHLKKKKLSLLMKRIFDVVVASIMLVLMLPIFLVIAILIKLDSEGPVFFRQERVTQYGKIFRIHKFRTMVNNAEKLGTQVSTKNDVRVTKVGAFIRKYKIDEFPQLIDIIQGNMSFVGTRPEVPKYAEQYTSEMRATLLLPAGVTSKASIKYKDEAELLDASIDVNKTYVNEVLPAKMKYNLESILEFNIILDLITMIETVIAVLG